MFNGLEVAPNPRCAKDQGCHILTETGPGLMNVTLGNRRTLLCAPS